MLAPRFHCQFLYITRDTFERQDRFLKIQDQSMLLKQVAMSLVGMDCAGYTDLDGVNPGVSV
ncbi:hypothetical protein ADS79_05535 [Brevibacillus reuszeri]|uniref:Uncharacterized protein n=1 Tax=Brevibacillus reuszeri TaxID=54915 RepID=A0A0K9YXP9_9BACL|nr:hypothetical protein ADS79_05535 [Brevibacillus reuszeri]